MLELIDELLGETSGCINGMGGSASIHSPAIKLYGHDGMMGSQVPIAVGFCYTTNHQQLFLWVIPQQKRIMFLVQSDGL